jgi:hypothetical protein
VLQISCLSFSILRKIYTSNYDPSEARISSRQSLDDMRAEPASWRQSRHDSNLRLRQRNYPIHPNFGEIPQLFYHVLDVLFPIIPHQGALALRAALHSLKNKEKTKFKYF